MTTSETPEERFDCVKWTRQRRNQMYEETKHNSAEELSVRRKSWRPTNPVLAEMYDRAKPLPSSRWCDHGSHIVPVIVGDPVHTKLLSDMLLEDHGIYVQPINYPTVPRGTERLRFTPSSVHGQDDMEQLVKAMDTLWSHCELNRSDLSA